MNHLIFAGFSCGYWKVGLEIVSLPAFEICLQRNCCPVEYRGLQCLSPSVYRLCDFGFLSAGVHYCIVRTESLQSQFMLLPSYVE